MERMAHAGRGDSVIHEMDPQGWASDAAGSASVDRSSFDALRRDVALLRHRLAEAAPRRAVVEIDKAISLLGDRLESVRGLDQRATAGERAEMRALADEVMMLRQALDELRAPERFATLAAGVDAVARKLDVLGAKTVDSLTVARLQAQIGDLTDLVSRALDGADVAAIAALTDRVAGCAEQMVEAGAVAARSVEAATAAFEQRAGLFLQRLEEAQHRALLAEESRLFNDAAAAECLRSDVRSDLVAFMGEMNGRLDQVADRIAVLAPEQGAQFAERLTRVVDRIEAAASGEAAIRPLADVMEHHLVALTQRVTEADARLGRLDDIETTLRELTGEMRQLREGAAESASEAARAAVKGSVDPAGLKRGLAALEARQFEIERRTGELLGQDYSGGYTAELELSADPLSPEAGAGEPVPFAEADGSGEPEHWEAAQPDLWSPAPEAAGPGVAPETWAMPEGAEGRFEAARGVEDEQPAFHEPQTWCADAPTADPHAAYRPAAPAVEIDPERDFAFMRSAQPAPAATQQEAFEVQPEPVLPRQDWMAAADRADRRAAMARVERMHRVRRRETWQRRARSAVVACTIAAAMVGAVVIGFRGGPTMIAEASAFASRMTAYVKTQTSGPSAKDLPPPVGPDSLRTAALAGDAAAAYEVGVRFADGKGVGVDATAAKQWLTFAMDAGAVPAAYKLGSISEANRNFVEARRLYLWAAERGNVRAMHNLGVIFSEGVDGRPDWPQAIAWFRRAADLGLRDAQHNLGIIYSRGLGGNSDPVEAWKWFALAANQGDTDSARKRDALAARVDSTTVSRARQLSDAFAPASLNEAANTIAAKPEWMAVDPSDLAGRRSASAANM